MTISRAHVSTHWGHEIYLEAVRWPVLLDRDQCSISYFLATLGSEHRETDTHIGHQCCDQLTAVKAGYPPTSITWPYRGLRCRLIELKYFLKLSADKLLVFKWSQAQVCEAFLVPENWRERWQGYSYRALHVLKLSINALAACFRDKKHVRFGNISVVIVVTVRQVCLLRTEKYDSELIPTSWLDALAGLYWRSSCLTSLLMILCRGYNFDGNISDLEDGFRLSAWRTNWINEFIIRIIEIRTLRFLCFSDLAPGGCFAFERQHLAKWPN